MERLSLIPPTRPLVLIVEGDEDARAMYALALSATGFDVVAVQDGDEAFGRAMKIHPDIIVADLPGSKQDGSLLFERLAQNRGTRDIPIVVASGYVQQSAEDCLPGELAVILRRVLEGRHAQVRR